MNISKMNETVYIKTMSSMLSMIYILHVLHRRNVTYLFLSILCSLDATYSMFEMAFVINPSQQK